MVMVAVVGYVRMFMHALVFVAYMGIITSFHITSDAIWNKISL